jgi:endonuclease YncB( thermonuclease family)
VSLVGYGPYNATLERAIDGDTAVILVDAGFNVFPRIHVRLDGIDTPELYGPEREKALKAKSYLEELLAGEFILHSKRWDRSFTRWVCNIELPSGKDAGDRLVGAGVAKRVL